MSFSRDSLSVYVHVPFCKTRCTYCAFNTYTDSEVLFAPFVDALVREIMIVGNSQPGHPVDTVYLGGGTPSLLQPEQVQRILTAIAENFHLLLDAEISLEANPNDLDDEYLTSLFAAGVNRISIGMQSANPGELTLFDRRHNHQMVIDAVRAARQANLGNLNLDLIYGIPEQTLRHWEISLRGMLSLNPQHVSLYALSLEGGTPLKSQVDTGELPIPDDDLAAEMYELASLMLHSAGYRQYEISNWSLPGYACRHNLQYWRNLSYIGLGPGAHGYAGGVRYSTLLLPTRYIQAMQLMDGHHEFPRSPATAKAINVGRDREISDTLIMGLRLTQEGILREGFQLRFGVDILELYGPTIDKYRGFGLLSVDDERVCLTDRGRLLSNVILREFV